MRKNITGFTIVELLIVIVVIAILASISIVAYNGIQQRAYNSQITTAARVYKNAIDAYALQNSQQPGVSGNQYCLGHDSATCVVAASQPNWPRDTTTLEPQLRSIVGNSLPAPNYPSATYATYDPNMGYIPARGGTTDPKLDGQNSGFLIYILAGSTTCPIGPVAGGSWPNYTSTNSNAYTFQYQGVTGCWVPLKS